MTPTRTPLSRERVLEAAIELADEGGIESLSMRKLARELGVEAMSLYNHVANKRDLVNGIVDLIVSQFELPADGDWETAVRRCAISAHEVLRNHPWACNPVITPTGDVGELASRLRYMEWMLRTFRNAGFSPDLTYHAYHALDSHIFGFTLWQLGHTPPATQGADIKKLAGSVLKQLPEDDYPNVIEHINQHLEPPREDLVSAFEFGLDLVLEGLRRAAGRS
jgi:AcrR family transcriptional regulator